MQKKQTPSLQQTKKYTLLKLLKDIFEEKKNKNGKPISASLNGTKQNEFFNLEEDISLSSNQSNDLQSMIEKTDPKFKVLTEIALLVMNRKNKMEDYLREPLLQFCVLIVSRCSIFKTQEKDDFYKDFIESETSYLLFLEKEVKKKYAKRINGLRITNEKQDATKETKHKKDKFLTAKAQLEAERDNVITIGAIYGLFNSVITHKEIIDFFIENFYGCNSIEDVEVALYIIQNRNKNEIKKTLFFYKAQIDNKDKELISLQRQIDIKHKEYSNLQESLLKVSKKSDSLISENDKLTSNIDKLKEDINELGKGEKAKRVHLHDDTKQAKARAINLLEDDILEPIRLCLSALQRDTPKVEVASDRLEIIEEKIERGVTWFKK